MGQMKRMIKIKSRREEKREREKCQGEKEENSSERRAVW